MIERVEGAALVQQLEGVAFSSGSACSTASPEPSHVLRAIGRDEVKASWSVRFGVGRENTDKEIDEVVERLGRAVARQRSKSALSKEVEK